MSSVDYMDAHTKSFVSSQTSNDVTSTLQRQQALLSMWTQAINTAETEQNEKVRGNWKTFADTVETQLEKLSPKKRRADSDEDL